MTVPRWEIPDDWNEGEDGRLAVLFCMPNSPKWRGLVVGHIETLCYGRAWNETTGIVKDAQSVGRDIFNSMSMCDLEQLIIDVGRVATAIEKLEEKTPELITLQDLLDDLNGNPASALLSDLVPIFELLTVLGNLFPSLKFKIDATDLVSKVFEYFTWRAPILGLLTTMDISLAGIALGALGSGASAFLQLLGTGSEYAAKLWYNTINGVGNFFSWWASLFDWWNGTGTDPEPTDEEKWSTARVFNDILINQGAVNVTNNIDVNACCDGQGGTSEVGAGGTGFPVPDGMGDVDAGISDRKCKAATLITYDVLAMLANLSSNDPPAWYQLGELEQWLRERAGNGWLEQALGDVYGIWITLAAKVFGQSLDFDSIYNEWDTNKDALVCVFFNAGTTDTARQAALSLLSLSAAEDAFLADLLTNNVINTLWYSLLDSEDYIASVQGANCSGCAGCPPTLQHLDLGTRLADYEYRSEINVSNDFVYVTVLFAHDGVSHCGSPVTVGDVTLLSDTTSADELGPIKIRYYDQDGTQIGPMYDMGTEPASVSNVGKVTVHRGTYDNGPVSGYFDIEIGVS